MKMKIENLMKKMSWTEMLNDLRYELFGPDKQPYKKALDQYRKIEKKLQKALDELDEEMKPDSDENISQMKDELDILARMIHNVDLKKYDVENVQPRTDNKGISKKKNRNSRSS